MKKSTLLAFTAAVLMGGITYSASAAPTYDDVLILPNSTTTPTLGSVVLVPVASPQTVQAVHEYVKAWENAEQNYEKAKVKKAAGEKLTKTEAAWLHYKDRHNYADYFRTNSIGYVHGQEVALNWNAENRDKQDYSYFSYPKHSENDEFVNSYGFNVLRGMVDRINEVMQKQKAVGGPMTDDEAQALEDAVLDIMAQDQEHVANEELRHYMNEAVWFASKETVKNQAGDEPAAADEHVVNLREAINSPIGDVPQTRRVDLRAAINN